MRTTKVTPFVGEINKQKIILNVIRTHEKTMSTMIVK